MLAWEGCQCSLGHKPTRNEKQTKNNQIKYNVVWKQEWKTNKQTTW